MFCDLGNVSVYYETYGEGFPIVMIHGFTPDHRLMSDCAGYQDETHSGK